MDAAVVVALYNSFVEMEDENVWRYRPQSAQRRRRLHCWRLCGKVVTACVMLHNICVRVKDELEEAAVEDDQPPAEHDGGESHSGAAWWTALENEVSSLQEAPLNYDYFAQVNTVNASVVDDHVLA
ncbi:hypothetical protein ABVT39_009344 [Epinephelus coioides]